jgi:hypothetical protein
MQAVKFVHWEEDGAWLGYLQDYPDYWTQGETLEDLKERLKDLYRDLSSGQNLVHDWQKEELARRKANLTKSPASGLSWEAVKQRVRSLYGR